MNEAPRVIDGAVVMEWAWSDQPFGVVGTIHIHGLAICHYSDNSQIYRFSCNEHWETEQDADYDSVEDAKLYLPDQYRNAPINWRKIV